MEPPSAMIFLRWSLDLPVIIRLLHYTDLFVRAQCTS